MDNEKIFRHPSYGILSIHRYSGGETEFFGSSINHGGGVEVVISECEQRRTLNKDWYMDKKKLIKVRMTETQFAQAITHLNSCGTPCTLEYFNGSHIEQPKNIVNKKKVFQQEFKENLENIDNAFQTTNDRMSEILDKKNISKADREELKKLFSMMRTKVVCDLPFIEERFNETMDKIVVEIKDEVEQFVENKIRETGLKNLNTMPLLKE